MSDKGANMKAIGLVLTVGVALGQPIPWEQHMKEGATCESSGRFQEARAPTKSL